jgi:pyridoxamine 5'-phosphate oxidase family protein
MSVFTEAELVYMQSQKLGRLGTVNQRSEPQFSAVGFHYNPELDTIDIYGLDMGNSQKFRNIVRNGKVSLLVDDVLPPWKPGCIEIRGKAVAVMEGGKDFGDHLSPEFIRIYPQRIIAFDANQRFAFSKRNVDESN